MCGKCGQRQKYILLFHKLPADSHEFPDGTNSGLARHFIAVTVLYSIGINLFNIYLFDW